jgi:3-oxoadipate enol-lactonase
VEIVSNGVRLHVTDQGSGSAALVFLHYWGGSSATWDDVVSALPGQSRVVRPDLRGWGESRELTASLADVRYRLGDFADDVMAIIESLGLQNYVLIGHSMGGKIAQLMASRRPRGLAGVVLVAPAPPGPLQLPPEALSVMASAYESEASVNEAIDHMLTAKPLSEEHRQQVVRDSLKGLPAAKAAWPRNTSREDITAEIARISVPVLVIAGELDKVDSVTTLTTELLSRIPHATLRVLGGTGHLSPLESPGEVATLVSEFIRYLEPQVSWGL